MNLVTELTIKIYIMHFELDKTSKKVELTSTPGVFLVCNRYINSLSSHRCPRRKTTGVENHIIYRHVSRTTNTNSSLLLLYYFYMQKTLCEACRMSEFIVLETVHWTVGERYQDDLPLPSGFWSVHWLTLFYPNGPQKRIYEWQWSDKTGAVGQM